MKLDLSTKEGYDIASAIRGPDARDEMAQYIKVVLTAPIRHLVGSSVGFSRKLDEAPEIWCLQCFTPEEVYAYAAESDWVQHYAGHIYSALRALSRSVDDWRLEVLRRAAWRLAEWGLAYADPVRKESFCDAWRELEKTWS